MDQQQKPEGIDSAEPLNPWRESLANCIEGSNYLRASEYRQLIEELDSLYTARQTLTAERDRLHALVNNPQTEQFLAAVRTEVAHQIERWGTVHDRAKEPADWFWLVGYLAGKALQAHATGDSHKALHHTISTAAALANWHAAISCTRNGMAPGHSDLQAFLQENFAEVMPGDQA